MSSQYIPIEAFGNPERHTQELLELERKRIRRLQLEEDARAAKAGLSILTAVAGLVTFGFTIWSKRK